jgi:YbbR domain-containing protein
MAWHPFRNVGLKIAALVLGTLLWLIVSGHEIERRVRVPVAYSSMPVELEMTSDQDEVSVHVRGTDTEVSGLGPGDLRVIVDLADAHPGTNLMVLRPELVEAPLGIEVLRIEPGTITVTLERSARKDVPVDPLIEGQPAAGFVIGDVSVTPRMVPVIGPESRLSRPISIVTDRIRLDGRRSRVEVDANVVSVDSQVRLAEPRRVHVVIQIVPGRAAE